MAKYKDKRLNEDVSSGGAFSGTMDDITNGATYVKTHNDLTSALISTWNGKSDLALGETLTTAYRGDRGKTAYDYSQIGHLTQAEADLLYLLENGESYSAKGTPVDGDYIVGFDSGNSYAPIIFTFQALKDELKKYFDNIYTPL